MRKRSSPYSKSILTQAFSVLRSVPGAVGPAGQLVLAVQLVSMWTLEVALGPGPDGLALLLLVLVVLVLLRLIARLLRVVGLRSRGVAVRADQVTPTGWVQRRAGDVAETRTQGRLAVHRLEALLGHCRDTIKEAVIDVITARAPLCARIFLEGAIGTAR